MCSNMSLIMYKANEYPEPHYQCPAKTRVNLVPTNITYKDQFLHRIASIHNITPQMYSLYDAF